VQLLSVLQVRHAVCMHARLPSVCRHQMDARHSTRIQAACMLILSGLIDTSSGHGCRIRGAGAGLRVWRLYRPSYLHHRHHRRRNQSRCRGTSSGSSLGVDAAACMQTQSRHRVVGTARSPQGSRLVQWRALVVGILRPDAFLVTQLQRHRAGTEWARYGRCKGSG
jgi:hypothetical protein